MLHIQPPDEIDYPTSDGEPMGETDVHRDLMQDLIKALEIYYQDQPRVYASGNLLMLYDRNDSNAHVAPDVMIALGVPWGKRDNYKIWEEGKAPDLVIEVTSKSTKLRDTGFKKDLYEALGVLEYLLFDPRNEYLKPRFQVFRLEANQYVQVLTPEITGYVSCATGLEFRVVDDQLRIFEGKGGPMLLTQREQADLTKREAARARKALARAKKAEALARREAARAEQEAARADREAARAEALEKELAALRAARDQT